MKNSNLNNKVEENNPDLRTQPRGDDSFGMFRTVSAVPTAPPKTWFDQIVFYSNSTTYRIYMYDVTNNVWRYATLT